MAFIIQIDSSLMKLDRSNKVIKAINFIAYKSAEESILDGIKKRNQIIADAFAESEAEKTRGYQLGIEAAHLEQSTNMISIISQTVDYFSKVEVQMVDLVMDAVRRIVTDFDDRDKVARVVRNALLLVRSQKHISIRVHPSQVEICQQQIKFLLSTFPAIEQIEVVGDLQLAEDACILDSDIGQVEASVSGQLNALRETFSNVFSAFRADVTATRVKEIF